MKSKLLPFSTLLERSLQPWVFLAESTPSEDLLTSFHLLLCIIEWVYKDLCFHDIENHIEPESGMFVSAEMAVWFNDPLIPVNHMMESKDGVRVLEVLCRSFGGVLLDAKHFRTHWFNQKRESALPHIDHKDLNISSNYKGYMWVHIACR